MLIPVPPKDSFDVEPGKYSATCIETREIEKQTPKGSEKRLRVVWELNVPGADDVRNLVGKNYEPTLARNSLLRNDLTTWFGRDINARQFDTATLKGKTATVTVQHIENEGRAKPYCWVAKVEPPINDDEPEQITMISPPANVVRG
jgi:hypothetical protein